MSRLDFYAAATALLAVLLLGILQGVLLAAVASILLLLARVSQPNIAFLGRIPGTNNYSDLARHPENEPLANAIVFRPEASLIYVNADTLREAVLRRLREAKSSAIRLAVCDLSAAPFMDLAGSRMLRELQAELASHGISLRIIGARGSVRDLLRADGIEDKVGRLDRTITLDSLLASNAPI
jgi:MFS superfamily sulfate permease-like transporter